MIEHVRLQSGCHLGMELHEEKVEHGTDFYIIVLSDFLIFSCLLRYSCNNRLFLFKVHNLGTPE